MDRRSRPDSEQAPAARGAGVRRAAAFAGVLLLTLLPAVAEAQQSPSVWSRERTAALPSGLTVRMDFSPLPGVAVTAAPGTLGEHAGSGAAYADGMRPGDPAETFQVEEDRPTAEGSWRTLGELRISFSRPVRNPRLHISGLTARAAGTTGTTVTAARLVVTAGTPAAPSLVGRTPWTGWTAAGSELAPPADTDADGASDGTGSVELAGTLGAATLRMEQRVTARDGATTRPVPLRTAFTVTLDESLGTAPQGYGNASHLLSDLYLGQDAADRGHRSRTDRPAVLRPVVPGPDTAMDAHTAGSASADDVPRIREAAVMRPLVELEPGGLRSVWANPAPPRTDPGRGEYRGADPTLVFPADTAVGGGYGLDVPVSTGDGPAVLAGWVDFDRNGRFDTVERVQAEVAAGASAVRLEWTVQSKVAAGDTWARLRIARDASQLVGPGGYADSGQVSDQRIRLVAGAAMSEITAPVDGAVTAETRPQFTGTGAVAGSSLAVTEDGTALCRTRPGQDGGWACRPDLPLAEGPHTVTAEETAAGGAVRRSAVVRVTVKTVLPKAPVLTLPAYTSDPGLLLTGSGEPGSTVSVTEPSGSTRIAGELCSTGVGSDGSWSCLPVEPLDEGSHLLTARAVDAAGNAATGPAATLTVDTVAPAVPLLGSPHAGESVPARPRFTGAAEAGSTVTVTARAGGGERLALCGGTASTDGAWACTSDCDLAPGEQVLTATATDRAGNNAAAMPLVVHVADVRPAPADPTADASVPPSAEPSVPPPATAVASRTVASRTVAAPAGAGPELRFGLYGVLPAAFTGVGLLTRRLLARGPGRRRR